MKRALALKMIHREVVATSAGHLALSNRRGLCRAGLENEAVITRKAFHANTGTCALIPAVRAFWPSPSIPRVAKRLVGEDDFRWLARGRQMGVAKRGL